MIRNYNELVDSIADELVRSDLRHKIPEWINMAELSLARYIKMTDGEVTTTGTFTAGQNTFSLPDRCKEPIHFLIGTAPNHRVLEIVSWPALTAVLNNDTSGQPKAVAFIGKTGYLAPAASGNESYTLIYYGLPAYLSEENPTNELLEMGADVLKYHALAYSAPYLGEDERLNTWVAYYTRGQENLKREYWRGRTGGGVLRMRNDVVGGDAHWR